LAPRKARASIAAVPPGRDRDEALRALAAVADGLAVHAADGTRLHASGAWDRIEGAHGRPLSPFPPGGGGREVAAAGVRCTVVRVDLDDGRAAYALTERGHDPDAPEPLLDAIVAALPGNVYRRVMRPDGSIAYTYLSRSVGRVFGLDDRGITGAPAADFGWVHPDDRDGFRAALERSAATLEPLDHECRVVGRDGAARWARSMSHPRRTADGHVIWDGLVLDVTDRRRAEDELRGAKDVAERANATKSRFLAAASHDLRQPLQSLAYLLAALGPRVRGREAKAILGSMDRSMDALSGLLDALLDISRLDAGVVRPRIEDVPLAPLAARIVDELRPQAEGKGLRLRLSAGRMAVRSDVGLLASVVRNLVSNAVRYTDRGGVLVACRRRGGAVRIEVWDSGIGIPEDQIEAVFEPFHQVGNTARDRSRGLGLGLAIADRLARLLGIALEVRSAPGRGSRFSLVLPAGTWREPAAASERAAAPTPFEGLSLLVIEDDAMVGEALVRVAGDWGCQPLLVSGAGEAKAAVAAGFRPDAVVCDYRLPGGATGAEAIAAIRAACGRAVPGVVVTGDTAPERLREAQASGLGLLHKPVRPAKLRALLTHLLRERGSHP
jgi:PAS domain S-box-containing protein